MYFVSFRLFFTVLAAVFVVIIILQWKCSEKGFISKILQEGKKNGVINDTLSEIVTSLVEKDEKKEEKVKEVKKLPNGRRRRVVEAKEIINSTILQNKEEAFKKRLDSVYYTGNRENYCRDILEAIFERRFPKQRPDFLINPTTGYKLELDCLNVELGLALEYNGEQHYIWPNSFNMSEEEFVYLLQKDKYKRKKCANKGIKLLIVPYTIPVERMKDYILNKLSISDIL